MISASGMVTFCPPLALPSPSPRSPPSLCVQIRTSVVLERHSHFCGEQVVLSVRPLVLASDPRERKEGIAVELILVRRAYLTESQRPRNRTYVRGVPLVEVRLSRERRHALPLVSACLASRLQLRLVVGVERSFYASCSQPDPFFVAKVRVRRCEIAVRHLYGCVERPGEGHGQRESQGTHQGGGQIQEILFGNPLPAEQNGGTQTAGTRGPRSLTDDG